MSDQKKQAIEVLNKILTEALKGNVNYKHKPNLITKYEGEILLIYYGMIAFLVASGLGFWLHKLFIWIKS